MRRDLLILAAFTLLLHLPFLKQPVQGDEVHYLDIAQQVLKQPLTPLNFTYVFQGQTVDASGHPHPPLNGYLAAVPWLVRGRFSLVASHLFYVLFALGISFAAYALAAYFTARPLWGALLVAASPIVQVNTNTVASPEGPALAFILAGAAAFFWRRFWIAGIALSLGALTALQTLAIPPILLAACFWKGERPPRAALAALALPYGALGGWQVLNWALTQRLPGAVLYGYVRSEGLSRFGVKAASAIALLGHLGVLVTLVPVARRRLWGLIPGVIAAGIVKGYPWWERLGLVLAIALGINALLWLWENRRRQPVLAAWPLLYFAFACAFFFAGAARYLLPLAVPMALLFVLEYQSRARVLAAAAAFNVFVGLNVSFAAYEFSRVYAQIPPPPGESFLINGEWGFRYHLLNRGGRMLQASSAPAPGEWMVSSALCLPGQYGSVAEQTAVPLRSLDLPVRTPLRLIDRRAHTGFSSASFGLLPLSFSRAPLDRITYSRTSPFLDVAGPWTPTRFSDRLVYLPVPGAEVRLPIDANGTRLRFALFGKGQGRAVFSMRTPDGRTVFEASIDVAGETWQVREFELSGATEVLLKVDAPAPVKAGWGELTAVNESFRLPPAPAPGYPAFAWLKAGDIRATPQMLSGWYGIEDGAWRWTGGVASALLKRPAAPSQLAATIYLPDAAPARRITLELDGKEVAEKHLSGPGIHTVASPVLPPGSSTATASLKVDRTFSPPGDARRLGVIVHEFGFREAR